MADEYGPTFITVTDEDGREIVLEFVDALEYNGQQYQAFFPAETEGEDEDDPDNGLVILKVLHEDGEDLLSTLDSDEELDAVYDLFMEGYQMIADLTDFTLGVYGTLHCVELQKLEIVGGENPCHAIVEALAKKLEELLAGRRIFRPVNAGQIGS